MPTAASPPRPADPCPAAAPAPPQANALRSALPHRLPGLALAGCGAAVLIVALRLKPAAAGLGTHTQLGFAPCGFEASSGLPCATCGMTTATALAAHGHLLDALRVQPAGALFALLMAMLVIVGTWSAWTGRSLHRLAEPLGRPRVWIAVGLVVGLAWGYRVIDAVGNFAWTSL